MTGSCIYSFILMITLLQVQYVRCTDISKTVIQANNPPDDILKKPNLTSTKSSTIDSDRFFRPEADVLPAKNGLIASDVASRPKVNITSVKNGFIYSEGLLTPVGYVRSAQNGLIDFNGASKLDEGTSSVAKGCNNIESSCISEDDFQFLTSSYHKKIKQSTLQFISAKDSSPLLLAQRFPKVKPTKVIAENKSLLRLLSALITKELRFCDLIIVSDETFDDSVVTPLSTLPNVKQVISINNGLPLSHVIWTSPNCVGSLFLMRDIEVFRKFGEHMRMAWNYNARVIFVGLEREKVEDLLQTRKLRKTEHVLAITRGTKEGHYVLYGTDLFCRRGSLVRVCSWGGRQFSRSTDFFPDTISNLRRCVLNVITFEFPPSIIYRRGPEESLSRYGLEIAVVEAAAKVVEFTPIYMEPPNGERWGSQIGNGSWNGLVGLLASGKGDIGIANIFISGTFERLEYQSFSYPFAYEATCYLARMEPPLPRWQALGLPFQMTTWMALLIGLLVAGPLLYILSMASPKSGDEQRRLQSLAYSTLYSFGVHFRHPYSSLPQRTSTQFFVGFLLIYSIVLTTGYGSNLTAFLTVTRQPASMETFQELYAAKSKVLSFGSFFKKSMESSVNKYLNALAEFFYRIPTFEEIKPKVLSGEGVMIQSRSYLEYVSVQVVTPKGTPMVRIMKECFAPFGVGLAFQSNSPLKARFDVVISWMVESGLVGRWFLESILLSRKYNQMDSGDQGIPAEESSEVVSSQDSSSGVIPLGVDHMQGIFIILVFGYLLSTCSFLAEKLIGSTKAVV